MKKIIFFVIFIVIVIGAVLLIDRGIMKKEESKEELGPGEVEGPGREPVVAGTFYPGSESELNSMVEEFFEKVELPELDKYIRGLIVPHAGYVYSGQVAAYSYKTLEGKNIDTVILIGNSHQAYFEGISVYEKGFYQTLLGKVAIDEDLAKKIIDANEKISFKENAHFQEHSLEVQLPFLQKVLKDFKIVPIIMGNDSPETIDILISALNNVINDNTLVIASSDLSHYPKYEDAQYSDNKVIEAILPGDRENLRDAISQLEKENIFNLQTCACGQGAIEVMMGLMEGKDIKLLKYANSGDVPVGDKSQVVGYAAIVFTSEKGENELGKEEQKRLLEIARESLETYIKEDKIIKVKEDSPLLNKPMGAFVTLKKHDQLRGCIGVFEATIPLYQVVAETAISSAINDVRFTPVAKNELDELEYEISVLSPLKKVDSWKDIEIGKHGVRIRKGARGGVFLPQVATDNDWDLDTFMSVLCTQKAGLPSDCWKESDIDIYVFTAQVFDEEDIK
jgi:AmmeMemoRadiSam system protein B/AmmeMemoRadiSam system protein A